MSWRNSIQMSLGLITFVVGLDTAVSKSDEGGTSHTVCVGDTTPHDPVRTKDTRECPKCENKIRSTFRQAVDTPDGLKLVSADDKADAKGLIADMKKKLVLGLHDTAEVSTQTLPSGSVYYLTPQGGEEAYATIVDLLRRHPEKVLMTEWVPSSRANQYQVRLFGDTLVMQEHARAENVKVVQVPATPANPAHAAMLDAFLPTLTTPYDPATYADKYAVRMRELLATKDVVTVEGMATTKSGKAAAPVIDLTAALEKMAADAKKPARKRAERKSA